MILREPKIVNSATLSVCSLALYDKSNRVERNGGDMVTASTPQAIAITDLSNLRIRSSYFLFVTMAKLIANYVSFELWVILRIYLWHEMRLSGTCISAFLKGISYPTSSTKLYLRAVLHNEETMRTARVYYLSCAYYSWRVYAQSFPLFLAVLHWCVHSIVHIL